MTTSQATAAAAGIFLLIFVGVMAARELSRIPEIQGLHGPLAEIVALPFVLLAFLGAIILAVLGQRRRDRMSRAARIVAGIPIWLVSILLMLWVAANLVPLGV